MFVLLEAILSVKDELRSVTMECEGLYVIIDGEIIIIAAVVSRQLGFQGGSKKTLMCCM